MADQMRQVQMQFFVGKDVITLKTGNTPWTSFLPALKKEHGTYKAQLVIDGWSADCRPPHHDPDRRPDDQPRFSQLKTEEMAILAAAFQSKEPPHVRLRRESDGGSKFRLSHSHNLTCPPQMTPA